MQPDGSYLAGKFARQSQEVACETIVNGLERWRDELEKSGAQAGPVPTNKLAIYGGEELRKGGLKLEVAYRDLPRGTTERPGDARFPNPYNLGWFDLSPDEAKSIVTGSDEKVALPDFIFQKLARTRLKDAVRGQVLDWGEGAIMSGQLFSELSETEGSKTTYRLSGSAEFAEEGRSFSPEFYGSATYDSSAGEFTDFRLIAAGQRRGKAAANGRETDLGPAPLAAALTLYRP